jgi:predicted dehydrogenase
MNWGIIATGKIAGAFAAGVKEIPDATLLGVASRSQESADRFGQTHNVPRRYGSYEALAEDPDIDVIYIGTPHPAHYENTLLCLKAGKHVVCEKPLAMNGRQVREMIDTARAHNVFLMEAMWMWFIPAVRHAKALVESGAIGTPHVLMADFGFPASFDLHSRLFDPHLGGGALLDIGIYPLALSLYLFGKPQTITGKAVLGQTGVDEVMTATLEYANGRIANLTATLRADTPSEAVIAGSRGNLRLHRPFWHSTMLTLDLRGDRQTTEVPMVGNGYNYEVAEAMKQIRAGVVESDVMSWQDSLDLMEMMDTLRQQWGLVYPNE